MGLIKISNKYLLSFSNFVYFRVFENVPTVAPDSWKSKRLKNRIEFNKESNFWLIHLTRVTTFDISDKVTKESYEVEFELKHEIISELSNEKMRRDVIKQLWDILLKLLGNVVARLEMRLSEVENQHLPHLQYHCWQCIKPEGGQGFPGSMPVSFSRRHFDTLKTSEYFISEKTDGIRYMLFITPQLTYMIGRKFDFYILDFPHLTEAFGQKGNTLIDGELVETLSRDGGSKTTLTFMMFDLIYYRGMSIGNASFPDRLKVIGKFFIKIKLEKYLTFLKKR